ncbi:MAG: hypothetical protein SOW25_04155 [Helicobacter sp.]|nr:hypothetical protein [Helicobacter sp.]
MKKLLLILALCGILSAKDSTYASAVKNLYLESTSTKVIGKLLPTTKVEVLEKSGDRVKLLVKGYVLDDGKEPAALYFVPNKRILNAGFSRGSGVVFKTLSSKEVEGKKYNELSAEVWSENSDLSSDLNAMLKKAKGLFEENCAMCHRLHPTKEYTANQWPSMFKGMALRTSIEKADHQLVIQYLQKNSKDIN